MKMTCLMTFHVCKNTVKANWKCGMKKRPKVTKMWCEIFTRFTKENINAVHIECLITFCSVLPGSNAPAEHVFSIINALQSYEKKTDLK
jgi:hypothetical protein